MPIYDALVFKISNFGGKVPDLFIFCIFSRGLLDVVSVSWLVTCLVSHSLSSIILRLFFFKFYKMSMQ